MVFNIHGSGCRIYVFKLRIDRLRIKESKLANLADGADHIVLAVHTSRLGAQFAVNNFVVGLVIAYNSNLVEICNRAFDDSDFKVDGIVLRAGFDGIDVREQIAVVLVEVGQVVAVGLGFVGDAFLQKYTVVYITAFDTNHAVEALIAVNRVAQKLDVAKIITTPFLDVYLD